MRCVYCTHKAGWWRRTCSLCEKLLHVLELQRDSDFVTLMAAFVETGASVEHIELFMTADPRKEGALRDRIAATMTNELLGAFGQTARQSPADVKRIRERGNWIALGERPRE